MSPASMRPHALSVRSEGARGDVSSTVAMSIGGEHQPGRRGDERPQRADETVGHALVAPMGGRGGAQRGCVHEACGRTDPADVALCVDGARRLLPVRAERHLERLHYPTAQHAIPGVALEHEDGGGAAADGDRRVLLHRQRGDQPVKKRWLIRESQCEVSTIHESAP